MAKIGFVGLGHMGLPMAINLIKAGHQVTGFDLQSESLNQFAQSKGVVASKLSDSAKGQDVLITMLQTGQQVMQVCQAEDGLLKHAEVGSLFIDCSTIDVPTTRTVHQLAKDSHLSALDAPVSGGVAGAEAGTLTFMVGGEKSTFDQAQPILSQMGQKIIHAGAAGCGQAAKVCNNMVLGISMIAVCEAFVLGQELGLSAKKIFEVINNSSGQCWVMSKYVPVAGVLDKVPANNSYKPGFAAMMMLKDLNLSQESAQSVQIQTILGSKARDMYQDFVNQGFGELDFSAIIQSIHAHKDL